MNQTKFAPVFERIGVPEWRISHLSDIPYILNENVAAGADNSEPQQELSELLSGSVAAFAWTGDPSVRDEKGKKGISRWPEAYLPLRIGDSQGPDGVSLFVVGGETGSGPAEARSGETGEGTQRDRAVAWEKVVERCAFINSITDELGV